MERKAERQARSIDAQARINDEQARAADVQSRSSSSVEHGTSKNKNNDEEKAMPHTKLAAAKNIMTRNFEENGEISIENVRRDIT